MNKKQYNFIKNNFIPAIKNLGYELQHENSELLKFSYNKILIFSFFIHKDFIQGICIYNGIEKKMFHIENLYLLDNDNVVIDNINFIGLTIPIEYYEEKSKSKDFYKCLKHIKTYKNYTLRISDLASNNGRKSDSIKDIKFLTKKSDFICCNCASYIV